MITEDMWEINNALREAGLARASYQRTRNRGHLYAVPTRDAIAFVVEDEPTGYERFARGRDGE